MSIKALLKEQSGLATGKPVAKRIEWEGEDAEGNPTKIDAEFYFRDLSAAEARKLLKSQDGEDSDPRFIAGILCEADGKPALTEAEAGNLKLTLLAVLTKAALEVIGLSKSSRAAAKKG